MRAFKLYSSGSFLIYDSLSLTVITTLYILSQALLFFFFFFLLKDQSRHFNILHVLVPALHEKESFSSLVGINHPLYMFLTCFHISVIPQCTFQPFVIRPVSEGCSTFGQHLEGIFLCHLTKDHLFIPQAYLNLQIFM